MDTYRKLDDAESITVTKSNCFVIQAMSLGALVTWSHGMVGGGSARPPWLHNCTRMKNSLSDDDDGCIDKIARP